MALPTGPAVTFLFTDIEGSTRLEQAVGSDVWASIVARHDRLLRDAIESNGGVVVKTEGDAFFAAFDRPDIATRAAATAQRAVAAEPWPETCRLKVRMGLHLGEGRLRHGLADGEPGDYVGIDVNYTARIAAAGNGGQVVLSQALVEALGRNGVTPAIANGNGVSITDEGLRAVKDFEEPRRLHRLVVEGAADDPRPLRTLDPPSNLPGSVTELVGRAGQIETLRDLLASTRILTLTGPGGSGKTRLALGVAHAARERFPHGTWFVDLASVREVSLLEPTMASTLGLMDSPERSRAEALREHLRDRSALLLLDNLEQLLPSAADIVASVARSAPEVRLLITSRELLRITGERGHAVPPLDTDAGVELFTARATALRPDLDLSDDTLAVIRQICERLSGLPLAIELAAARIRLLSPALILERLGSSLDLASGSRDLPERQRTLRGAIGWSHDLLSEPERRLFRRLATFAGGWTAELALPVVDPDGDLGVDILEGLESLADKSLLRIEAADTAQGAAAEPRFDMHPLLRDYALEWLEAAGERDDVEARHAAAVAALTQAAGPNILGPAGQPAIRRLDREQHNVRAAIAWALRTGDSATGLRVAAPIWRWFQQRGLLREGREVLGRLLLTPPSDIRLHIDALAAVGGLAYWADDATAAAAAYEQRLALAEETGDQLLEAEGHYDLGFISMLASDPDGLREHESRALELFTAAGATEGIPKARQALVLGVFLTGDYDGALELEGQNLAEFRAAGADYQIADSMTFHAGVFLKSGDAAASWAYVQDGLRWFAENDNQSGIARALGMAAIVLLTSGDAELGARAAGATYRVVEEKGVMLAPVKVLHLPDPKGLAIERLGEGRAEELLLEGADVPVAEVIADVLAAPGPSAWPDLPNMAAVTRTAGSAGTESGSS
jgi:predicted ATPase/class 3 adenylate cyclase